MNPVLEKLLELQDAEQQILRLEDQLKSLPLEMGKRQALLQKKEEDFLVKQEKVKTFQIEADRLDLDVRTREEKIKKVEGDQAKAKSNAEYTAFQHQIGVLKEEVSKAEDRAISLLDEVEELQKEISEIESVLEAERETHREFIKSMEKEEARITGGIKAFREKMSVLALDADPEALEKYRSLMNFFSSHGGGVVLAPVVGGTCKACGSKILPNDEVKLLRGFEIIRCKGCGRINYLPNNK